DPAARAEAARQSAYERFRRAWDAAPDGAAAARALGLTERRARQRAAQLRALGVPLKQMPWAGPWARTACPRPVADRIARLYRRRLGGPAIARRTGASRTYVFAVLRRLRAAGG